MAVVALNKQALDHTLANDWLLLLSTDLATFYGICSTTGLHLMAPHIFGASMAAHNVPCHRDLQSAVRAFLGPHHLVSILH